MKTITEVNTRHRLDVTNLENEYKSELKNTLKDYQEHAKYGKREEIKAKHIKKLQTLQETKEKRLKAIYNEALDKTERVTNYNDLSHNEMIFVTTILNGGNIGQIQNIASKYINNEDVKEMVKASVNKLENKQAVLNVLDTFTSDLEEAEQELKSLSTQNTMEEFGIFNRIV